MRKKHYIKLLSYLDYSPGSGMWNNAVNTLKNTTFLLPINPLTNTQLNSQFNYISSPNLREIDEYNLFQNLNKNVFQLQLESQLSQSQNLISSFVNGLIPNQDPNIGKTRSEIASSFIQNSGSNPIQSILNSFSNLKDISAAKKAALAAGNTTKGLGLAKMANIGNIAGTAADVLGGFLPLKQEYAGPKGGITAGLDSAYDNIANTAMAIPGIGTAVGGIMKANAFLGKGLNALGGGTDGMTSTDAILGSSFLAPIGAINGFFGKKSDTIKKNEEAFALVGSSYGGSNSGVDFALQFSGKKYGAFSSGARKDANALISEMRRQQNMVEDIGNEASNRFALQSSMSAINGNARAFEMQGGYDQAATRVGRHGMKLQDIYRAKRIVSSMKFIPNKESTNKLAEIFKDGGIIQEQVSYITEINSIPDEYKEIPEFKDGGLIPNTVFEVIDIDPEFLEVDSFKEGGSFNVIPEGALHARKHNMENAEGLTKKGIPVVDNEGSQLCEIEREELIFRLEVTKALEDLMKKYNSEEYTQKEKDLFAIEAGKLLTKEILYNTVDNTNNLL